MSPAVKRNEHGETPAEQAMREADEQREAAEQAEALHALAPGELASVSIREPDELREYRDRAHQQLAASYNAVSPEATMVEVGRAIVYGLLALSYSTSPYVEVTEEPEADSSEGS